MLPAIIFLMFLVGGGWGVLMLRRKYHPELNPTRPQDSGFSLSDIRRMKAVGQIDDVERKRLWQIVLDRAFTLTEVLIAVAILGIGLSMAAALFPAALKENERSVNASQGMLMAKNGLAIAQIVLRADDVNSVPLAVIADEENTTKISLADQHAFQDPNNASGAVFIGGLKECIGYDLSTGSPVVSYAGNQLVVVSYRKRDTANIVAVRSVSGDLLFDTNLDAWILTATSGAANLRVGSPLISRRSGLFATIKSVQANMSILDHQIKYGYINQMGIFVDVPLTNFFVVLESNVPQASPAQMVLGHLTRLR